MVNHHQKRPFGGIFFFCQAPQANLSVLYRKVANLRKLTNFSATKPSREFPQMVVSQGLGIGSEFAQNGGKSHCFPI